MNKTWITNGMHNWDTTKELLRLETVNYLSLYVSNRPVNLVSETFFNK